MAEGKVFECSACSREVEAWDEGEPYYFDALGAKRYAFHPDPQRALCTGLDVSGLCLHCGAEIVYDTATPITRCPQCAADKVVEVWKLEGQQCPWCKAGVFHAEGKSLMVS